MKFAILANRAVNILGLLGLLLGFSLFLPELIYGGGSENASYGLAGFLIIIATICGWLPLFILMMLIKVTLERPAHKPPG
jgi:hypothetical protein